MAEPKLVNNHRLFLALLVSLIVLWSFWVTIWYQPTWGADGNFQPPAWGQWEGRDRFLVEYGIALWVSAAVSAYLTMLPMGGRLRQRNSASDATSLFLVKPPMLEMLVTIGSFLLGISGIVLLLIFGIFLVLILAVLASSTYVFHLLRQPQDLPWYAILASPWLWTFSLLPLVGIFGMFAPFLVPLPIISTLLFGFQATQRTLARIHWLAIPVNTVWLILLFRVSSDWFTLYGD